MSDDTQKTVSEETIASIIDAAQDITQDSDAMRQNLIAVAEALQPIIQRAGIRYGSLDEDQIWVEGSDPDPTTVRIGIRRHNGKMRLGIEESQYYLSYWDGSNWIGHDDPFSEEAYANYVASFIPFSNVSRMTISCAIERLPDFIEEYAAELKRRHQKYSDLRKKIEQIKKVLESE